MRLNNLSRLKKLLPVRTRPNAHASNTISRVSENCSRNAMDISIIEATIAAMRVNKPRNKRMPTKISIDPTKIINVPIGIGRACNAGRLRMVSAQMSFLNFPMPKIIKTMPRLKRIKKKEI